MSRPQYEFCNSPYKNEDLVKIDTLADIIRSEVKESLEKEATLYTTFYYFSHRMRCLLYSLLDSFYGRVYISGIILMLTVLNVYTFIGIAVYFVAESILVFCLNHYCFFNFYMSVFSTLWSMFRRICCCCCSRAFGPKEVKLFRYRPFYESVFEYAVDTEENYENGTYKCCRTIYTFLILFVCIFIHVFFFENLKEFRCNFVTLLEEEDRVDYFNRTFFSKHMPPTGGNYSTESLGDVPEYDVYYVERKDLDPSSFIFEIYYSKLWTSTDDFDYISNCKLTGLRFLDYYKAVLIGLVNFVILVVIKILVYNGPGSTIYSMQLQKVRDSGVRFPKLEVSWIRLPFTRTKKLLQDVINLLNILRIQVEKDRTSVLAKTICESAKRNIPCPNDQNLLSQSLKDPVQKIASLEAYNYLNFELVLGLSPFELGFLHYFFIDSLEDEVTQKCLESEESLLVKIVRFIIRLFVKILSKFNFTLTNPDNPDESITITILQGSDEEYERIISQPTEEEDDEDLEDDNGTLPHFTIWRICRNARAGGVKTLILTPLTCGYCFLLPVDLFSSCIHMEREKILRKFIERPSNAQEIEDSAQEIKKIDELYSSEEEPEEGGQKGGQEGGQGKDTDRNEEDDTKKKKKSLLWTILTFCIPSTIRSNLSYFTFHLFYRVLRHFREFFHSELFLNQTKEQRDRLDRINTKALFFTLAEGFVRDITFPIKKFLGTNFSTIFLVLFCGAWFVMLFLICVCELAFICTVFLLPSDLDLSITSPTTEDKPGAYSSSYYAIDTTSSSLWAIQEDDDVFYVALDGSLGGVNNWSLPIIASRFGYYFLMIVIFLVISGLGLVILVVFSDEIEEKWTSFSYERIHRMVFREKRLFERFGCYNLLSFKSLFCCFRNNDNGDDVDLSKYDSLCNLLRSIGARFDFLCFDFLLLFSIVSIFFFLVTIGSASVVSVIAFPYVIVLNVGVVVLSVVLIICCCSVCYIQNCNFTCSTCSYLLFNHEGTEDPNLLSFIYEDICSVFSVCCYILMFVSGSFIFVLCGFEISISLLLLTLLVVPAAGLFFMRWLYKFTIGPSLMLFQERFLTSRGKRIKWRETLEEIIEEDEEWVRKIDRNEEMREDFLLFVRALDNVYNESANREVVEHNPTDRNEQRRFVDELNEVTNNRFDLRWIVSPLRSKTTIIDDVQDIMVQRIALISAMAKIKTDAEIISFVKKSQGGEINLNDQDLESVASTSSSDSSIFSSSGEEGEIQEYQKMFEKSGKSETKKVRKQQQGENFDPEEVIGSLALLFLNRNSVKKSDRDDNNEERREAMRRIQEDSQRMILSNYHTMISRLSFDVGTMKANEIGVKLNLNMPDFEMRHKKFKTRKIMKERILSCQKAYRRSWGGEYDAGIKFCRDLLRSKYVYGGEFDKCLPPTRFQRMVSVHESLASLVMNCAVSVKNFLFERGCTSKKKTEDEEGVTRTVGKDEESTDRCVAEEPNFEGNKQSLMSDSSFSKDDEEDDSEDMFWLDQDEECEGESTESTESEEEHVIYNESFQILLDEKDRRIRELEEIVKSLRE